MLICVSYCPSDPPDSWWTAIDGGAAPGWATTNHGDGEDAYDGTMWDAPGGRDHDRDRDAHAVFRC